MAQTLGITKAITNLTEAHARLNLSRAAAPSFFAEWQTDLPPLTETEQGTLDRLKAR